MVTCTISLLNMNVLVLLSVLVVQCSCMDECLNVKTHLGMVRKRRHLTFPDNSDIVLTISLVKAFMTHAPSGWNIALEIDVLYPLPDGKTTNRFFRKKLHHKQKREFWEKIESALGLHNMNGRACMLRSICEARTYVAPRGISLVHDILRVIFTAPLHDEEFREEMTQYHELSDPHFCDRINDCPFSLIDFILSLNKQKTL